MADCKKVYRVTALIHNGPMEIFFRAINRNSMAEIVGGRASYRFQIESGSAIVARPFHVASRPDAALRKAVISTDFCW